MTSKVDFGRPSAQPKFLQFPNTNLSDFSQFSRVLGKSNIKFAKSVSGGLGKTQCRKRSHFFIVKNSTPKIILRKKWNLCRTPKTMDLPEANFGGVNFTRPFFVKWKVDLQPVDALLSRPNCNFTGSSAEGRFCSSAISLFQVGASFVSVSFCAIGWTQTCVPLLQGTLSK